jgi:4-amino-4-deoxy-L-arabinose transferase-like glycosyltransferase
MTACIRKNSFALFFSAATLFLLFWSLGYRELWGSEDRWAEITREMFCSGDYFHPTINGEPYFDKPLLSYWFIAITARITGSLNELTTRIPSAVAGLIALWATFIMARRMWSDKTAATAIWILLTSYGFIFWARTAAADMANLTAVILAIAWYQLRKEKLGFVTYLVFYLICFTGAHAKGLAAVAIPLIAVFADVLVFRTWRKHICISHVVAMIIGFAVYLFPFIYASTTNAGYTSDGLYLVFRENIQRFVNPFDHKEPFFVYFYYLPELLMPWSVIFVGAVISAFYGFRKMDKNTVWLLLTTLLIFLFFTASGSRRVYYIMPILPFCAIMSAVIFHSELFKWKNIFCNVTKWSLILLGIADIACPLACLIVEKKFGVGLPLILYVAGPLAGLLAIAVFFTKDYIRDMQTEITGSSPEGAALILSVLLLMGTFFCFQYPALSSFSTNRSTAFALKAEISKIPAANTAFFTKVPVNMLFYIDRKESFQILESSEAVKKFIAENKGPKLIISFNKYADNLKEVLPRKVKGSPIIVEKGYFAGQGRNNVTAWKIDGTELD